MLRYYGGEYRVNAGYFRDRGEEEDNSSSPLPDDGGFRTLGEVRPYVDIRGPAGTHDGDRALEGFLEARQLSGFRFSLLPCPTRNSVSIEWTLRCGPVVDMLPGVCDVEGVVECGLMPVDDRRGRNGHII